tara:strand:- start:130 stop:390 length:261 start_codon:yes stop_codon:yes gene_type:complete
MAITKVVTVNKIEVYPGDSSKDAATNAAWPRILVEARIVLDDTTDAELPVTSYKQTNLGKFNGDGTPYDTSGEDALVQTLATALWS